MAMRVMTVGDLLAQQSQQSEPQVQPGFRTMTVGELLGGAAPEVQGEQAAAAEPNISMSELPWYQRMSGRDMSPQFWIDQGFNEEAADRYAEKMARFYRTEFQRGQEAMHGVRDKTYSQAIGHGLGHGGLSVLRDLGAKAKDIAPAAGYLIDPLSYFKALIDQKHAPHVRAGQWAGGELEKAAEEALAAHPEWGPMEIERAADLLKDPKLLVNTLAEMAPFSGGALAAHVAGGPALSFAFSAAVEGQLGTHEALAYYVEENGGKPLTKDQIDKANKIGNIYGAVAGGIETLQVGHIVKAGSAGKRAILKLGLKKLFKNKGAAITVKALTLALTQAGEEMAQGVAQDVTAGVVGGIPAVKEGETWKDYVDDKLKEGIPAAISSLGTVGLLGGGSAMVNRGSGQRAAERREAHLAHNAIENAISEATAAAGSQLETGEVENSRIQESGRSAAAWGRRIEG